MASATSESGKTSDFFSIGTTVVTLNISSPPVPVSIHKNVICAVSPYFRTCFKGPYLEAAQQTTSLPDVSEKTFRTFMDWAYAHTIMMRLSAGGPHLRPMSPLAESGSENGGDEGSEDREEENEGEELEDEENEEGEHGEGEEDEEESEESEDGGANFSLEEWLAAGANSPTTLSDESDQNTSEWDNGPCTCLLDSYFGFGQDSEILANVKASPGWREKHDAVLSPLLSLAIFADKYAVTQLRDDILTALFMHSLHWSAFPAPTPEVTQLAYENLPPSSQFLRFLAYSTAYQRAAATGESEDEEVTEEMRRHHPEFWLQVAKVLGQRIDGVVPWDDSLGMANSCQFHEHEELDIGKCVARIGDPSTVFEVLIMDSVEGESGPETTNKWKGWKRAIAKWRRPGHRASSVSGRSASGESDSSSRFPFEFRPWVVRFANRLPSLRGKRERRVRPS